MRPFEIITLLLITGSLTSLLIDRDRTSFLYLLFASIVGATFQFFLEGLRWQFLPSTYLLPAMFMAYKFQRTSIAIRVLFSIWWALSIVLPWAVPVFTLPTPKGNFEVGTETFHWVDSSRLEWFTEEITGDVRELMVQVWYPGENTEGLKTNGYMDFIDLRAKALAKAGKLPAFLPGHLSMIKTNSFQSVDLAEKNLGRPVLIFSHGITGSRHLHQVLFEYLASYGYVVFAPDHSFDCNLTIFPDGRIADYRSEITGHPDSVMIREKQIRTRALDIGFIIDQIEKIDNGIIDSKLNGKLNLDKIALGGHSYGGATAVFASYSDRRIKACMVLDSWINPLPDSVISKGLRVPFLFMGRPHWDDSDYPTNYKKLDELMARSSNDKYHLHIKKTLHLDYTDIPLMSPLIDRVMDVGNLPPAISLPLVNQLAHGFLDKYLLGGDGQILNRALMNKLIIRL